MATKIAPPILDDDSEIIPFGGGAPPDFAGPVYQNPDGVYPKADTDPAVPGQIQLTGGAKMSTDKAPLGKPKMDTSNPPMNQIETMDLSAAHAHPPIPSGDVPPPAVLAQSPPEDLGAIANGPTAQPTSILGDEVAPGAQIAHNQMGEAGKLQFHSQMRDFGVKEAQNIQGLLALDPADPQYRDKLANYTADQGKLKSLKAWYQQMHPWGSQGSEHPGVFGKIGHVLGEIGNAAGGNALNIPGSQQNLQNQFNQGQEQIKQAGESGLTAAQQRLANARPELEQTKLDLKEQQNKNTAEKNANTNETNYRKYGLKLDDKGQPVPLAPEDMSENEKAAVTLKHAQADSAEARKLIADLHADPNSPENDMKRQKLKIMAQALGIAAGHLGLDKAKYVGDYLGVDLDGNPLAGVEHEEGTDRPIGPKISKPSDDKLTAATKTMVEAAPHVLELSKKLRQEIIDQQASLGPAASRWSEFMAGKVGAPNKDFTALRTNHGLLTTLLMRMHVGARGSEAIMAHFKDLLDTGKQSPDNLLSALDQIDSYAEDVKNTRPVHTPKGSSAPSFKAPEGAPSAPKEDGHKLKSGGKVIAISRGGQWQSP